MLNPDVLKYHIKSALSEYIPKALATCKKNEAPIRSSVADKAADDFAEQFDAMVSEPLATSLAYAIDYYIKNATITGTLVTSGSPVMQVASVIPAPNPMTAGEIPNTLGIS